MKIIHYFYHEKLLDLKKTTPVVHHLEFFVRIAYYAFRPYYPLFIWMSSTQRAQKLNGNFSLSIKYIHTIISYHSLLRFTFQTTSFTFISIIQLFSLRDSLICLLNFNKLQLSNWCLWVLLFFDDFRFYQLFCRHNYKKRMVFLMIYKCVTTKTWVQNLVLYRIKRYFRDFQNNIITLTLNE